MANNLAVSVQQAAANAAVSHLKTAIASTTITPRWVTSDFQGKAITLITAGSRRDEAIDPRLLSNTNQGTDQTQSVWQVAECTQSFQLDVWAQTHSERDDLIAQLDSALRAGLNPLGLIDDPFGNGFWVNLLDGWDLFDATAYFSFDAPDYEDTPESITRRQFRATYRGDAHMKLTLSAPTRPRQLQIILKSFLDGDSSPSTDTLIQGT